VAGIVLAVAPWTIRNFVVFGKFVPVTTNSTVNLYMGNNPEATGGFNWRLPSGAYEIWNKPSERGALELQIYRMCGQASVEYMKSHPGRTVALWPAKAWVLWGPVAVIESSSRVDHLYRVARWGHWLPFLVVAVIGLWVGRRHVLVQAIGAMAVVATMIHMLTYGDAVYRAPYEFLFAVPAAGVLGYLVDRVGGRRPA
jgi:hypothetical protein